MTLTQPEKLIISMLAALHEKLGIEPETAKLINSAIYSNNTWALTWELPGIVGDQHEPNPPAVTEVTDYLDMWSFIEQGLKKLDAAGRAEVDAAAGGRTTFPGFDGNNEGEHYSVANFLIKDMRRFSNFAKIDLNSHHETLPRAAAMYRVFKPIRAKLDMHPLSKSQLISILSAKY